MAREQAFSLPVSALAPQLLFLWGEKISLGFVWMASAFRRITAARLLEKMPVIAAYLESGRVSLTKLCHLKDRLTEDNCEALLDQAAALGEKEVEALAVSLDPGGRAKPPKDRIRPIMLELASMPPESEPALPMPEPTSTAGTKPVTSLTPSAPPPVRYEIRMTVGSEFMEELAGLKDDLAHSHPDGRLEELLLHCI